MQIMPVEAIGTEHDYKDPFSIDIKNTEKKDRNTKKQINKKLGNTQGSRTETLSCNTEVVKI